MSIIADAILALRDLVFGTLNGALKTGYRWASTVFPWSAGVGLLTALGTGNAAHLGMGALVIPAITIGAGWVWGGVTEGIHAVNEGLKERRYNRRRDAAEHEQAHARAPAEPVQEAPALPPAPPPVQAEKPALDTKKAKELGLTGDPGPSLAFREDRPSMQISEGKWQGLVRQRCGPQAVLG